MHEIRLGRAIVLGALLAACDGQNTSNEDAQPGTTSSQALSMSADKTALYVATGDDDVVARLDLPSFTASRVDVPGEPTRVTRVGDRVLVTLRTQRAVLELTDNGATLVPGRRVEIGPEPVGIVATTDGTRVFVAVSMAGEVVELDGETLALTRRWAVEDEPRWLALHPTRPVLYVASAWRGTLSMIDLDSGAVQRIATPTAFEPRRGIELSARVTGDPAAATDGGFLAVPMLFLDSSTPITETATVGPSDEPDPGGDAYSDRVTPVVAVIELDDGGMPTAQTRLIRAADRLSLGYPASVSVARDNGRLYTSFEGGSAIGFIDLSQSDPASRERFGIEFVPNGIIGVPAGPRAVLPGRDGDVFVYGFLDRQVAQVDVGDRAPWDFLLVEPFGEFVPMTFVERAQTVADGQLPAEVERGRRMFYAANDPAVTRVGGGVSCATCHFEGRADGLTWQFDRGPRQTPSLAGLVSMREPVRWDGDRATVADDALMTSQGLMGGFGLSLLQAQDIATFIDFIRSVDNGAPGMPSQLALDGRDVFNRQDVGCATCHSGVIFTDKQRYSVVGAPVKTPSLLGVAATPPYYHDGSAPTLRAVLEHARSGAMGNTALLTEYELTALEAYLRSL